MASFISKEEGGKWRHVCDRCGKQYVSRRPRLAAVCCDPQSGTTHDMAYRAVNGPGTELTEARTEKEQAAIAATCRACPHFNATPGDEGCTKCGCASSRHEAWLSKLRIGRWPFTRYCPPDAIRNAKNA